MEVASSGVLTHPTFASGFVALGNVYSAMGEWEKAIESLNRAVELAPENILAQSLIAEAFIKTKQPKKALSAFKMVLFLQPNNSKAMNAVKKLESLTADEYEDELFQMQPLKNTVSLLGASKISPLNEKDNTNNIDEDKKYEILDRLISLADAFLVRNDVDRAQEVLNEAEQSFGSLPEIIKRYKIIQQNSTLNYSNSPLKKIPNRFEKSKNDKIKYLKDLLSYFQSIKP